MNPIRRLAIIPALLLMLGSGNIPRTPAVPDHAEVTLGGSVLIDVLANDTPLGDGLVLERVVGVSRGEGMIEDGQLRYIAPATSSVASTRFGYVVRLADGSQALGVVQVEFLQPVSLRLQGRVINAVASCDLRALAGGQVFEGCIDAEGRFDIELPGADADALVVLEASAPRIDTGESERRFSMLRSVAELTALALDDGVLDVGAFSPLRVTPLTTAHHAMLATANDGQPVDDAERLVALQESIDAAGVLNRAVVYENVATGVLPLPPSATDAYAVIAERETYDALVDRIVGGDLSDFDFPEASLALVSDADNLSPWRGDAVPGTRVRTPGSNPGTIAIGFRAGDLVQLAADGGARVVRTVPGDAGGTWQTDADGRVVFPVPPTVIEQFEVPLACPSLPDILWFELRRQTEATELVRLVEGPGVDITTLRLEQTVLNRDEAPEDCQSFNLLDRTALSTSQDRRQQDLLEPRTPFPSGRISVQLPFPDFVDRPGLFDAASVVDLTSALIDVNGYLPQVAISIVPNGRLRLGLQPSDGSGEIAVETWRVRSDGLGGEQWYLSFADDEGTVRGRATLAVPEEDPDFFEEADNVVGRWLNGVDIAFAGTPSQALSTLEFELDPLDTDGTGLGRQRFVSSLVSLRPFRWQVVDGVVEMRILRSRLRSGDFADCPEDDPADCYVSQLRTWQPLLAATTADDVERLYVLESVQNVDENGQVLSEDQRNRFMDRQMVEPTAKPGQPPDAGREAPPAGLQRPGGFHPRPMDARNGEPILSTRSR